MTPTNNLGWLGGAPQLAATPNPAAGYNNLMSGAFRQDGGAGLGTPTLPPPPNMQQLPFQFPGGQAGFAQSPQQLPVAGGQQWRQNTQHPSMQQLIQGMRPAQPPGLQRAPGLQRPTAPQFNADALRQMATKAKSTTQPVRPPSVGYIGGR